MENDFTRPKHSACTGRARLIENDDDDDDARTVPIVFHLLTTHGRPPFVLRL